VIRRFDRPKPADRIGGTILRMRNGFLSCIACWAALACAPLAGAADWPCWRGPNHDSTAEPLTVKADSSFEETWKAEVGTGFSSVVIVDQRAWTMGNVDDKDSVICLKVETGEHVWRHDYPAPLDPNLFEGGPTSTPTFFGGRLFTISRRGEVFCLDAESGQVHWQVDLPGALALDIPSWGFSGSPLVQGDNVVLNVGSSGVALNRATGQIAWSSDNSDEAGYSTPLRFVQDGRELLLIMSGKSANCVDPTTGDVVWKHRWVTRYGVNAADPHPFEGHVFLSSGYGKGSALLKLTSADPEELWRSRDLRNQLSPGILSEGHVYAVDGDAGGECDLVCFSIETQKRAWSYPGLGAASLIRSGENLIVLSEKGELVIAPLSSTTFEPTLRQQVTDGRCWTMPALANGHVYVRNSAGVATCLRLAP
jgi:outer membrane protein assembly factor BamB